ncbi:MAG: HlyD family efflux transporter periplasmic adaptor subunit [Nostoc sp.]|uniref:HlyD family secretion protein n=1 Tax=Nostoc sp. TaxID=1180 RepID=UPI002FFB7F1D
MTQQIHFLPPIRDNEFLPPISRWTQIGGLVIVGIMGIGMTLSAVTHYKMTVKAQATIRPVGELRLVQAATEGAVRQVLVKENQLVERGEAIATIDDARLQTKKSELQSTRQQAQLQLVQINAQISTLNRQIAAETNRVDRAVAAAQAELSQRDRDYQEKQVTTAADLEEAEATVKQAIATLQAAQTKQRRYQEAAEAGALSRDQVEEVELAVRQQEQAVAAAKAKRQRTEAALNPSHAEVTMAAERIAQEQANHELQQIELDLRQTTIAATADGIVANLHLRNPGQTVRVGESIAEIVPGDAPLEEKAAVSPQDRSKLKPGQRVQMRVSACPYPDYGVLNGHISRISEDTVKPPANAAAPDAEQSSTAPAFYEVTIAPERRSLGRRQH